MRSELKEVRAAAELEEEQGNLRRNQQAIKMIEKWHDAVIEQRVRLLTIEPGRRSADKLLYCHEKDFDYDPGRGHLRVPEGNDAIAEVFENNRELVTKWYAEVHGIKVTWTDVVDRRSRRRVYGTLYYMTIDWSSDEQERKMKDQLLRPGRRYTSDMKLSMKHLEPHLTTAVINKVMSFVPTYTDHLKQQTAEIRDRLASPKPW